MVPGRRAAAFRLALVSCLVMAGAETAVAAPSEAAMVDQINSARARHGVPPLRRAPRLERSASAFARHLMRTDRFGHAARIRAGSSFRALGEVLAMHGGRRPRRPFTVRGWLRSPPHRSVILSPAFRRMGAGRATGRFRGRRATIWVVQVGRY